MAGLSRLTDRNFAEIVSSEPGTVVVDFWAAWCPPCRVLARELTNLAADLEGSHHFHELDVDVNPRTAAQYGVRSLPTVILFSEGREIGRIVGALPGEVFRQRMEAIVEGAGAETTKAG